MGWNKQARTTAKTEFAKVCIILHYKGGFAVLLATNQLGAVAHNEVVAVVFVLVVLCPQLTPKVRLVFQIIINDNDEIIIKASISKGKEFFMAFYIIDVTDFKARDVLELVFDELLVLVGNIQNYPVRLKVLGI